MAERDEYALGCPGYHRHWFAPFGMPKVVCPTCSRCRAPNPRWNGDVEQKMRRMMGDEFVDGMLHEPAYCQACDLDVHVCPGCGQSVPHETVACDECQLAHSEGGHGG